MAMKKVGGPARNEIRSRATSASACSGSKRRTSTERIPAAPGTRTPLSRPEMWAIGAGISTASDGPRPCTRAISDAFQLRPRWVCSTALGMPGRARGEQDQRDVGGPAGTGAGAARGRRRRRRPARRGRRTRRARARARAPGRSGRGPPRRPPRRRSAGPAPPRRRCASRPGSGRRRPGCWGPARPRRRPGGRPGLAGRRRPSATSRVRLGGREAGVTVDHLAAVRGRSARRASARPRARRAGGSGGPGSAPRSVGGGPSRQGTIPGPR